VGVGRDDPASACGGGLCGRSGRCGGSYGLGKEQFLVLVVGEGVGQALVQFCIARGGEAAMSAI